MKLIQLLYSIKMVLLKNHNLILSIFILTFFSNCTFPERNCKNFHIGKFYSEIFVNETIYKSIFYRKIHKESYADGFLHMSNSNHGIQIEEFEGKIDSFYFNWINECEMRLSKINPKSFDEKKSILIKILNTTDSSYTYEYSIIGENIKQKAEAIRIK